MRVNGKPCFGSKRISLFNILKLALMKGLSQKCSAGASFTREGGKAEEAAAETTTAEYIIVMCWWMQGGELRQGPIKAQVIDLFVEPSHLCISDATKARLFFSHQKVRLPRQQLVDNRTSYVLNYWTISTSLSYFSRQGTLRMSRVCL